MSSFTDLLANQFCGGSSRKLISGWWYSILLTTTLLAITAFAVMNGTGRPVAEGFASIGSALISVVLSVGGTMILRKFHNSLAVGFFMGSILSTSQMFFTLALVYLGYGHDQKSMGESALEEYFMAVASFLQSALLGSFALLLTAHRTELENPTTASDDGGETTDVYTKMPATTPNAQ